MVERRAEHEWVVGMVERMFRDGGEEISHILDDIENGAFEMAKDTILLSSGERIEQVVRDVDFMILCDGRQYARCTHEGKELTIARRRGAGLCEWHEMHTYTASIEQGACCWATTLDAESPLQALKELRAAYPGILIREIDFNGRLTLANLHEGWSSSGPDLLDEALEQESEDDSDYESSEERLERQAQAHLEAAARHRNDPMFF